MPIPSAGELAAAIDRGNVELARNLDETRKGLVIANAVAATAMGVDAVLPFNNRLYDVPPVPWPDGIVLQKIRNESERLKGRMGEPEVPDRVYALLERSVDVMGGLIRPRGRFRRFAWRLGLRRNPFRNCSEKEVGELLDFFWVCRMKSNVLN